MSLCVMPLPPNEWEYLDFWPCSQNFLKGIIPHILNKFQCYFFLIKWLFYYYWSWSLIEVKSFWRSCHIICGWSNFNVMLFTHLSEILMFFSLLYAHIRAFCHDIPFIIFSYDIPFLCYVCMGIGLYCYPLVSRQDLQILPWHGLAMYIIG